MGLHWFFSIALGVVATIVAAAFGATTAWAAGIGLIVFVAYWIIRFVIGAIDGGDIYDLFDW